MLQTRGISYDNEGYSSTSNADCACDGNINCDIYFNSDCTASSRFYAFGGEDNLDWFTEGICGGNSCYKDSHCEPIFDPSTDYQGTGYWPGMDRITTDYLKNGVKINYPLIGGMFILSHTYLSVICLINIKKVDIMIKEQKLHQTIVT